ncbi:ABC transporter ATP-binding protein [Nonomuraea sp. NPDC046802]|uniref:ABC transporter ATP-binding protein n=1 Tax=Nonomuraea sp. NPDC046802 TaxID=3154919 RepID=UPI0033F0FA42
MTTASPEAAVTTRGLRRDYGDGAGVFGVDLTVRRGSVYGLVGLNGAGKTTLLMMLAGLRRPDSGEIRYGVSDAEIAICPDVPEFEPWLTAAEVVASAASLIGRRPGPGELRETLTLVGLADVAERRVKGFSRGMTQRLGLATALIGRPQLLILDEPASGLDVSGRADMLRLIESLTSRTTVVFSSHLLADVERVCDDVGVLRAGQLIYQGPVRHLVTEQQSPTWRIAVRGVAQEVADLLVRQSWIVRADPVDPDTVQVEATSVREGEHGVPAVLSAAGHGIVGLYPREASLEAAFAALTSGGTP